MTGVKGDLVSRGALTAKLDALIAAASCEWGPGSTEHNLIRDVSDALCRSPAVTPAPNAAADGARVDAGETFQERVQPWLMACFGEMIAGDREERNHRFLEEALELVQACGCTASEAHQLVDYVYGRPIGEPAQEVGGVMVTLAALCLANGLDMHANGETELARIWTKVEAIRAKQAAKPKHSPLPMATHPVEGLTGGEGDEDAPCTDCGDTGTTLQTERRCSCDAGTLTASPSTHATDAASPATLKDRARAIVMEHGDFPPDAVRAGLFDNTAIMDAVMAALASPATADGSVGEDVAGKALEALEWANDRLRECGKQVDFSLGMCMTLSDSEKRADDLRAALRRATDTRDQGGEA